MPLTLLVAPQRRMSTMRGILNRAVAREAPHLTNPFPASSENLLEGLKIFRDNCAGCHGDGAQKSLWARDVVPAAGAAVRQRTP